MAAIAIGGALPMEAAVDGGTRPDDGPAVSPLSANSVSDTRAATRGPAGGEERGAAARTRRRRVGHLGGADRPLLAPGTVPLVTPSPTVSAQGSAHP